MKLFYGADEFLAKWVMSRLPTEHHGFGPCVAIGVQSHGQLAGAVVFHEYRPHCKSIQMSCAGAHKRWLSRTALEVFFSYPFVQLQCERITAIVAKKNRPSRSLVEGVGFKLEGVVRKGFGLDDAIIYGMLKHECRWLKGLRHERRTFSTSSS